MSLLLKIIGGILTVNGVFLCLVSNFNIGVILTLLLGLVLLFWGVYYKKVREFTKHGVLRIIKIIAFALIIAEIFLVGFIAIYGQSDNVQYREDAVIVLGAGVRGDRVTLPLRLRLDKAVEYHSKNPDALIVVTGGRGFQETATEASVMEKYLLGKGVPQDRIIKEEKATSTNENMRFSKEILDGVFEKDYSVVVITNNFHIYRGVQIARIEGFEGVYHMHAGLQWYNMVSCYLRESLAVIKMWLFG